MTGATRTYFGSDTQQALLKRGADLHILTRNERHLAYYGRTVGIAAAGDAPLSTLLALARLQGNSNIADVPDAEIPAMRAAVENMGYAPVHYARWVSNEDALKNAQALTTKRDLPEPYLLDWLSPETVEARRQALADTCLACGVLPPSMAVLSGATQPAVCAMAVNAEGTVTGCAAAAAFLHPDHPDGGRICWWGMLAVHPEHRGQALSLLLGAHAMVQMAARYGFSEFFTGVEPGNAPSEAICSKMAFSHRGRSILGVADPSLIPGGRMTK